MDANNNQANQQQCNGPVTSPLWANEAPQPQPALPYRPVTATPQTPRKSRNAILGPIVAGSLMLGMVLGGAGAGAVNLIAAQTAAPAAVATTQGTSASGSVTESVAAAAQADIHQIYEKVSPSVVMISSVIRSNGRFGSSGAATGTGIVVDNQGNILTNYHVIQGATSLKVTLSNGSEYTATVVGSAPQDDLAMIKAEIPANELVVAELGDSSAVQVGDEVIAIGYPFGLDQSVTSGIVSGLNRDGAGSSNSRTLSGLIQVDAAINPGNSGGPLVNADGQVIGINTMIESPVEAFTGVGLVIPIDHAKSLFTQLEAGGEVARPWIGISGVEISSSMQQLYNLSVSQGILVMDVTANSPAEKAGLQGSTLSDSQTQDQQPEMSQLGDIITAVDSQKVSSVSELTGYLNGKKPGDQVSLTIVRNGSEQKVTVTLQAWPGNAQ